MRRVGLLGVAVLLLVAGVVPAGAKPKPEPIDDWITSPGPATQAFPQDVASGEVTARAATLWTRTVNSPVRLDVSTTPNFSSLAVSRWVDAPAADNRTVHHRVGHLSPNTRYYYRFYDPALNAYSRRGTFQTAPAPGQDVDVHFAWSGDSDGWTDPATGLPAFNYFETLDAARYAGAQFFVYLGDIIYSDSSFSPYGPADTLAEYRRAYRKNRSYDALRDLMAAMPTYANWDDHEVRNDWDAETVDPVLRELGTRAFEEYMPGPTWDPEVGFYRTFRWGRNVQFFILDERSFRDLEAHRDGSCDNPPGSGDPDLVPMLPQALRNAFAALIPQLASPVPQSCIDALNDPSRSMLGDAQKERFLADLAASAAKFKVVFSGDPIQTEYALPYDRWEGYLAERGEILDFIADNGIGGVVFLATDQHDNVTNDIFTDFFTGTDTGIDEAIVGPIATNTFRQEIINLFGDPAVADTFAFFLTAILGAECASLDTYAWGDVRYDAGTETLTIQQLDQNGTAVCPPLVLT